MDRFPKDWQEVVQYDAVKGEKHIADVLTAHGLVADFSAPL